MRSWSNLAKMIIFMLQPKFVHGIKISRGRRGSHSNDVKSLHFVSLDFNQSNCSMNKTSYKFFCGMNISLITQLLTSNLLFKLTSTHLYLSLYSLTERPCHQSSFLSKEMQGNNRKSDTGGGHSVHHACTTSTPHSFINTRSKENTNFYFMGFF